MKNPIHIFLLLAGLTLSKPATAQWRLLYQSQDITNWRSDTLNRIISIESRGTFSKYFVVRSDDNHKSLVLKNSVWGYIDNNDRVWRSYGKECFLLTKYNGGWVEYAVNRLVSSSSLRTYMQPMYSRTLNSRIYANWQSAMSDVPPSFILK